MNRITLQIALIAGAVTCIVTGHEDAGMFFSVLFVLSAL